MGKVPSQGLEHTLAAEKMYLINFTDSNKKFYLSLHFNGANSYFFVNSKEIHQFKAKDSEIVATPLCLGNILKDWKADNMKKNGLNGYDFTVYYRAVPTVAIPNMHKYLMTANNMAKNETVWNVWVYQK